MPEPDPTTLRLESGPDPPIREVRLIHKAHSRTQADIRLVEVDGRRFALRDYSAPRGPVYRALCRWAIRREVRTLELLRDVRGIPALVRVLDPYRYLMEFVDGPTLKRPSDVPSPEFYRDLTDIVRAMHERGVAHGDLRNKNVLIDREGNPHVVDFSTAWWGTSLWRRPLFGFYRRLDLRRLARSKEKMLPGALTEEDRRLLAWDPLYLRIGRLYRRGIYPLVRKLRRP